LLGDLGDALSSGCMLRPGQTGFESMMLDGIRHLLMISRHPNRLRAAGCRFFSDMHHHRLACDIQQRFAGKPGGIEARWNNDDERGHFSEA